MVEGRNSQVEDLRNPAVVEVLLLRNMAVVVDSRAAGPDQGRRTSQLKVAALREAEIAADDQMK